MDYAKQHLVPLLEWRFRRGGRDAVVTIDGHVFGVAICKDMDFPRLSRRYGRAGIEAMLVPAWNQEDDGVYHARMAVLRGVEQGFGVIRTANQGMLMVSDPYGRIVAETASAGAPVATLAALAPLGGSGTVYGANGDTFAWFCIGITAALTVRAVRSTKRGNDARGHRPGDLARRCVAAVD